MGEGVGLYVFLKQICQPEDSQDKLVEEPWVPVKRLEKHMEGHGGAIQQVNGA